MRRYWIRLLAVAMLMLLSAPSFATLRVLACEPEWGALTQELAGSAAEVYTATTALQDVHHVQARPSLIAAARRADLVICTGADLEIGWLPVLLRESGNNKIQPGQPGYFEATRYVHLIEVPARLDRSQGDVHPLGNPHIQTDARNIAEVARALAERLTQLDPSHADLYRDRYQHFAARWQKAIVTWQQQAQPLKGLKIVEQHRAFSYLFDWLGIEVVGYLEPKPGVEPTTRHMAELLAQQRVNPAKLVVRASFNDPRASQWFSQRANIPAIMLPFSVGGDDTAKDLFSWYDDMLTRLLKGAT
jgi:zinc/manganese transport system substrate-binding protein